MSSFFPKLYQAEKANQSLFNMFSSKHLFTIYKSWASIRTSYLWPWSHAISIRQPPNYPKFDPIYIGKTVILVGKIFYIGEGMENNINLPCVKLW